MRINRIVAMALIVCLTLSFGSFASFEEDMSQKEMAAIATRTSEMLALEDDITTITVSERQMVEKLLASGEITETMLRDAVRDLQTKTTAELQAAGFSNMQIERIQGMDAYESPVGQLLSSSSAYVTFQYGLITGLSDRDRATIAYDIVWSECPLWTLTDSFGVGWRVMNSDSLHVITDKVDIYVAYGHTYIYLTDFADYSLDWITGEAGISFSPKPQIGQNLIFNGSKRQYIVVSSGGEAEEEN